MSPGHALRSPRAWLVALAAAILLAAALAGFNPLEEPSPTPSPGNAFFGATGSPALLTLRDYDLVLDYPSSWGVFRYEAISSFSRLVAYIGTVAVPDPCERSTAEITCGLTPFHLDPGSLVVTITAWGFPGRTAIDDPAPGAVPIEVGGLPGLRETVPTIPGVDADRSIQWRFARPDAVDNWYEIRADVRGPEVEAMLAEVQDLVNSVRWDSLERGPSGSP